MALGGMKYHCKRDERQMLRMRCVERPQRQTKTKPGARSRGQNELAG